MRLILLGAPGAGRDAGRDPVQAARDPDHFHREHPPRSNPNRTETGLKAKAFMDQGNLVPTRSSSASSGTAWPSRIVQTGISSTVCPARSRRPRPWNAGIEIDCVISIEIDDAVIEQRMTGRRVCGSCGSSYHVTANPPKN